MANALIRSENGASIMVDVSFTLHVTLSPIQDGVEMMKMLCAI
ncbi:hypothetical protein [Paenibacillus sp. N3/727]|nr:hypothetical protein [Paenibacillus sp. N3/727]